MRRFFGKKEKEETVKETQKPSALETICGDDKEAYEALYKTMFLTPKKITTTIEEVARKAEDSEKAGDLRGAMGWFRTAGGLAIFKGDVEKVKKFFREWERLSGKKPSILQEGITERALAKAKEYYDKYPEGEKEEEKEEKK
jgi:hypothetical protein